MRPVVVRDSPLVPVADAVEIPYRESGEGVPLLHVHSGWGHSMYPFIRQIEAFGPEFRIVIPSRFAHLRRYGVKELPVDFHRRAADEMIRFLDGLGVDRPILWGHSDGAVVAAWMALKAPGRFPGVILEALHFYRSKPVSSAAMLAQLAEDPDLIGERAAATLAAEHGETYWRDLIRANSRAWLKLGKTSSHPKADLYDGRLSELRVPTLFLHGSEDPRTEPDELESLRKACPQGQMHIIEGARHSPHTEKAAFEECNQVAGDFLCRVPAGSSRLTS